MPLRLGPGPVFVYESIAATRRWQQLPCGHCLCWVCCPHSHSLIL